MTLTPGDLRLALTKCNALHVYPRTQKDDDDDGDQEWQARKQSNTTAYGPPSSSAFRNPNYPPFSGCATGFAVFLFLFEVILVVDGRGVTVLCRGAENAHRCPPRNLFSFEAAPKMQTILCVVC